MIHLPSNTPASLTEFCSGCQSNEAAVEKLKTNPSLMIELFQAVANDGNWTLENRNLAEMIAVHLSTFSDEEKLTLDQARTVRATAKIASERFDFPAFKSLANDDVQISTQNGTIKINHLLFAGNPFFTRMFKSGMKESLSKTASFPEMNLKTAIAIKTFLETGSLAEIALDEETVFNLLEASREFDIQPLALELARRSLCKENASAFLEYTYDQQWGQVRDEIFREIEKNFEGIRFTPQGFKGLHIDLSAPNFDFRELAPFLEFFNPDAEDSTVSKDFEVSVKVGMGYLPKEGEAAQHAADRLFNYLPFCRSADFSEVVPLTDGVVFSTAMRCTHLKRLNLKGGRDISDNAIAFLMSKCREIEKLNLEGCSNLTNNSLAKIAEGTKENLKELNLLNCKKIEEAALIPLLQTCPNIKILSLGNNVHLTNSTLDAIAENLEHLEELKVIGSPGVTDAGWIRVFEQHPLSKVQADGPAVTNALLAKIAELDPNVKELTFTPPPPAGHGGSHQFTTGIAALSNACRNLKAIEFKDVEALQKGKFHPLTLMANSDDILRLITNNPGLERIAFGDRLNDAHVKRLAATCPSLKSISLIGCGEVSEETLRELSEKCPRIDTFEIGWNYHLKKDLFREMIDNWAELKSLALLITGHLDATGVEYAIKNRSLESLALMPGEDNFERIFSVQAPDPFITTDVLRLIPVHCPNMKMLSIHRRFDEADSSPALSAIAHGCRNLESFFIHVNQPNPAFVPALLANNPKLATLSLERARVQGEPVPLIRQIPIEAIEGHPLLRTLNILEPYNFADIGSEILDQFRKVEVNIRK